MDLLSTFIAEYMSENERKALMLSTKKGLAMKGSTNKVVIEEKDKQRPIFFEELFVKGQEPNTEDSKARKERDKISFDLRLLKRVGIEKDENVLEKLKRGQRGHDLDRKAMFAAVRNRDISSIKTFLEQSTDYCHIKDKKDNSPLHIACQTSHLGAIKLLIESGSDLGQKDKKGFTPFHLLFQAHHDAYDDVKQLLDSLFEAVDEGFAALTSFPLAFFFILLFYLGISTLIPQTMQETRVCIVQSMEGIAHWSTGLSKMEM